MKKLTQEYKLFTYSLVKEVNCSQFCKVDLVLCTLDDVLYMRKEYSGNKQQIFYAVQKIQSPYIPKQHEVIYHNSKTIVIEEYIEGKSLQQILDEKSLQRDQLIKITKQLLLALAALHEQHVIHKDIKPSNIMLDMNGDVKLIDFGISKYFDPYEDKTTELLGTVGYAPPEQYGDIHTDFRSDIFSFGVTLENLINAVEYKGILCKLAQHCTYPEPKDRFQTAGEIQGFLNRRKYRMMISTVLTASIILMLGLNFYQSDYTKTDSLTTSAETTLSTSSRDIITPSEATEITKALEETPGTIERSETSAATTASTIAPATSATTTSQTFVSTIFLPDAYNYVTTAAVAADPHEVGTTVTEQPLSYEMIAPDNPVQEVVSYTVEHQGKTYYEDKIDYPFVSDKNILGKWQTIDYIKINTDFSEYDPRKHYYSQDPFLIECNFLEDGTLVEKRGESNDQQLKWTNGLIFSNYDSPKASIYQIVKIEGTEYLFYQWKSGDYWRNNVKNQYYILIRK